MSKIARIEEIDYKNKLAYNVNVTIHGDENEHRYFSITGNVRRLTKKGTPDRRGSVYNGAIADRFVKAFPKYKELCDLHLCELDGSPVYAVENGVYYIEHDEKYSFAVIANHFHISTKEAIALYNAVNQLETKEEKIEYVKSFVESKRADWQAVANKYIKEYNL